jgi:hypothetical protein
MRKGILAIFLSLIFCFSSVANAVVDGVISAEEAPYGRVVIPDDKLILEKEVKKSIETGDSAAAKSQALNVLNAEAGNDKSVLKNEMVVFDAVNTSVPREVKASDVEYVWDFDDGSYGATGKQVVHRFISEGVYRVKLTVKAGGKESSDQMVVSVFSNQVILLSDEDLSDSLSNELGAKFSLEHTNVIHLKQLNTLGSDSFKEEAMLSQLMANYSEGLRSTSFIFVHGDVGLRVLSRIQTKMNLDFDSKNIIFLNEGDLSWFKKKFLSLFYRQLNPKRLIYANYDFSFSDFIRGDFSDYKMIDGKGVGFVTKFLAKFLSLGYSFQTVYF